MSNSIQLDWLSEFQTIMGNQVWLDSGTLLGMIRDKGIVKGDKDVDLGMWENSLKQLSEVINKQKLFKNCKTDFKYYKRAIYHISISSPEWNYPVHINVYRKHGEYAICAQGHSLMTGLIGIRKKLVKLGFIVAGKFSKDRSFWALAWPLSKWYQVYTWRIPAIYFTEIVEKIINEKKFFIPKSYNEYLNQRYGDWSVPNPNWKYWIDDKCIVLDTPERVINFPQE